MYIVGKVLHGTGMVAGIVLVQCAGIEYSTFLVSKLGNFTYRTGHYFTAHNVHSVYQIEKALAVVYVRLSTLEQAHYVWCTDAVEPLGVGYPLCG